MAATMTTRELISTFLADTTNKAGHDFINRLGEAYKAKYSLCDIRKNQGAIVNAKLAIVNNRRDDVNMANSLAGLKVAKESLQIAIDEYKTEKAKYDELCKIEKLKVENACKLFDNGELYSQYCEYIKAGKTSAAKKGYANKYLKLIGLTKNKSIKIPDLDSFLVQDISSENVKMHRNVIKPIALKSWLNKTVDLALQSLLEYDLLDTSYYTFSGKEFEKVAKKAATTVKKVNETSLDKAKAEILTAKGINTKGSKKAATKAKKAA